MSVLLAFFLKLLTVLDSLSTATKGLVSDTRQDLTHKT